jgi:hypothetical protein
MSLLNKIEVDMVPQADTPLLSPLVFEWFPILEEDEPIVDAMIQVNELNKVLNIPLVSTALLSYPIYLHKWLLNILQNEDLKNTRHDFANRFLKVDFEMIDQFLNTLYVDCVNYLPSPMKHLILDICSFFQCGNNEWVDSGFKCTEINIEKGMFKIAFIENCSVFITLFASNDTSPSGLNILKVDDDATFMMTPFTVYGTFHHIVKYNIENHPNESNEYEESDDEEDGKFKQQPAKRVRKC